MNVRDIVTLNFTKKINLALQGGGAHGAFTWGVLDRLLKNEKLSVDGISGTSAGALNAVAVAAGLMENGPEGARTKLQEIWNKIYQAGNPYSPFLMRFLWTQGQVKAAAQAVQKFTQHFSPYEFNPMDLNPLHDLLEETIDFESLRAHSPVKLFIAATNVSTGRPRIFTTEEISADVVMASACLPTIFKAIKIEKDYYWDGGFSANPDLMNLIGSTRSRDTLLVQLTPLTLKELPTTMDKILENVNRITFSQPLRREIETIHHAKRLSRLKVATTAEKRYKNIRFHLINASRVTAKLDGMSKMRPEKDLLERLFQSGQGAASRWLKKNWQNVGRRSTADLYDTFCN